MFDAVEELCSRDGDDSCMSLPSPNNGNKGYSNTPKEAQSCPSDLPASPDLFEAEPSSQSSDTATPPVSEIEFRRGSLVPWNMKLQSYISRRVLFYAVFAWTTLFVVVVTLEKAGVTQTELHLEDLLPAAIPRFEDGWSLLNESISSRYASHARLRPGYQLAQQGAKVNYPVVVIPGFVTSGLELWGGKECARKYFRERMWGGVGSARQFFMERDCWREHLALDPLTGGDPDNIRLRPAQSFEAADYFMGNYWVWNKLIENLADVGYDGSTMTVASYDWRLAFPMLEKRDGYFTKLRHSIEAMHEATGKKVVLAAHSMGSQVVLFFFAWVTASKQDGGGGKGKDWVETHIHSFVNIAGPLLGVPKAMPALLSGEMKDTAVLLGAFGSMIEQFFGRRLRRDLWISWGSLWAMLPKGGDALWGIGADILGDNSSEKEAPIFQLTDKYTGEKNMNNASLHCKEPKSADNSGIELGELIDAFSPGNDTALEDLLTFLSRWGGGHGPSIASAGMHSFDESEGPSNRTWSDPSRTPLPLAPSMKIYCLYGVGIETERAYYYKRNVADMSLDEKQNATTCQNRHYDPPFIIDTSVNNAEQKTEYGVRVSDGDGSVPLVSLGYLCTDAWKRKDSGLNPSNLEVVTREYLHRHEFLVDDPMRSGPHGGDHVDILGNLDMTEDFLRIVTDFGADELRPQIVSEIEIISKKINSHPRGGLNESKRTFSGRRKTLSVAIVQLFSKLLSGGIV